MDTYAMIATMRDMCESCLDQDAKTGTEDNITKRARIVLTKYNQILNQLSKE